MDNEPRPGARALAIDKTDQISVFFWGTNYFLGLPQHKTMRFHNHLAITAKNWCIGIFRRRNVILLGHPAIIALADSQFALWDSMFTIALGKRLDIPNLGLLNFVQVQINRGRTNLGRWFDYQSSALNGVEQFAVR